MPTLDAGNFALSTPLPVEEEPSIVLVSHRPRGDLYEFVLPAGWTYSEKHSVANRGQDLYVKVFLSLDTSGELSVMDKPAYEGFGFNELYSLSKAEYLVTVEDLLGWEVVNQGDVSESVFRLTGRKEAMPGHCTSILHGMLAVTEERTIGLFLFLCNHDETDTYGLSLADLIFETLWYEGKPE